MERLPETQLHFLEFFTFIKLDIVISDGNTKKEEGLGGGLCPQQVYYPVVRAYRVNIFCNPE